MREATTRRPATPSSGGAHRAGGARSSQTLGRRRLMGRRRAVCVVLALSACYAAVGGISFATSVTDSSPSSYSAIAATTLATRTLTPNKISTLQVAGVGVIPAEATAVQLSLSVSSNPAAGSLFVYADGDTRPGQAAVLWQAGQAVTQSVSVGIGTNGEIKLTNGAGTVSVTITAVGYYTPNKPVTVDQLDAEDSNQGEVVTSNGDGTASWTYPDYQPAFTNTTVVPASGNPDTNGAALRDAVLYSGTTLIKLDPGYYDLGSTTLTVPSGVEIEGSSEAQTTIEGSASTMLTLSDTSELSQTRVESEIPSATDIQIPAGARAIVDTVQVLTVQESPEIPVGIASAGSAVIENSDVEVNGSATVTGISLTGSAQTTLTHTSVVAYATGSGASIIQAVLTGASTNSTLDDDTFSTQVPAGASTQALTLNDAGILNIRDSTASANGVGLYSAAILAKSGSTVVLSGSSLTAFGAASQTNAAVFNNGSMTADTTSFAGAGGSNSFGIDAGGGSNTVVQQSKVSGATYSISRGGATMNVGGSYVAQATTGVGAINCIDDYKANFTATTATCG
ncbi:hypothetical protein [Jatrophihabitans sp.]|uniref:hypothetical protein n=1 Tax=Jatrophihabitans sp. TaxID=1932789 RepID=UPI0030C74D98|nr:hypothetical protein [Jatrophihabitans sp.]